MCRARAAAQREHAPGAERSEAADPESQNQQWLRLSSVDAALVDLCGDVLRALEPDRRAHSLAVGRKAQAETPR